MKTTPVSTGTDWYAVERDYRAGILSYAEMAKLHGISKGRISQKAKELGWTQDLNAKIQARADDKLAKAQVFKEYPKTPKPIEPSPISLSEQDRIIEDGAAVIAAVRLSHRQDINRGRSLVNSMLSEIESQVNDPDLYEKLGELMHAPDESGLDRLNMMYRKVIEMPGRVQNTVKLIEAMKSLIALEREAYNIGAATLPDQNANPLVSLLMSMRRSALPVVQEVARDDSL